MMLGKRVKIIGWFHNGFTGTITDIIDLGGVWVYYQITSDNGIFLGGYLREEIEVVEEVVNS
jgi:hypothetical protein